MSDNENDIFEDSSDEESVLDDAEDPPKFSKKTTKITIDVENNSDSDENDDIENDLDDVSLDDNNEKELDDVDEDELADDIVNSKTLVANATSYVNDEDVFVSTNNEVYEDNEEDEEADETYLKSLIHEFAKISWMSFTLNLMYTITKK